MASFLQLPRELRDIIYNQIDVEPAVHAIRLWKTPRLVVDHRAQGLLLANRQTSYEFLEHVRRRAHVVICLNKDNSEIAKGAIPEDLSRRTKHMTIIVDLNGLHQSPPAVKDLFVMTSELMTLLNTIDHVISAFDTLQTVEMQWWNDLSIVGCTSSSILADWVGALIGEGVIKPHELWFGYLGGRLQEPLKLREHILSVHNQRKRTEPRVITFGRLGLVP